MTYDPTRCTATFATFRVTPGGQDQNLKGSSRYTILFLTLSSFPCVHSRHYEFVHVDGTACVLL